MVLFHESSCVSDVVVVSQMCANYVGLLVVLNSWGGDRSFYVNLSALRWMSLRISVAPLDSVNCIFLRHIINNPQLLEQITVSTECMCDMICTVEYILSPEAKGILNSAYA